MEDATHMAETTDQAPRHVRHVAALRQGMSVAVSRFPVAIAACLACTTLQLLMTSGLLGTTGGSNSLLSALFVGYAEVSPAQQTAAYGLASNLASALAFALSPCVVAQLAAEARDAGERRGRQAQAVALAVAAVAYLLGKPLYLRVGRDMLFQLAAWGIAAACAALACWLLMTRQNQDQLMPRLVRAALYTLLVTGTLGVGLLIVTFAAEALVGLSWSGIYECIGTLCGSLVAPCVLLAQLPRRGDELESPRAYTILVGMVVFPLCLLLLGVLYAYIGRIALTREMPSGEMNWYGSFALLVYVCLWLGMRMVGHRAARLFVRWGWVLLVPVVATQLVGIHIRLSAYGLTTLRYASLVCLAVGIFALVLGALGASPRPLFMVAAAAAVVACVSPANVYDVPNMQQADRLRGALEEAGMLGADGLVVPAMFAPQGAVAERIADSWDYLRNADQGYLGSPLVDDLKAKAEGHTFREMFGFERPADEDDRRTWWYARLSLDGAGVDVAGFSRAYSLDAASDGSSYGLSREDGYRLTCAWGDGSSVDLNLRDLLDALVVTHPEVLRQPDDWQHEVALPAGELRVDCGDGRVLALTDVDLEVSAKGAEPVVESVDVQGVLLVP